MAKQDILLGHSPDSDDAFMFYALAEEKIDTQGMVFKHTLQDIETLNKRAAASELDLTAISVHAYAYVHHNYALLTAGGSMGDNYGPMVVTREPMDIDQLKTKTVAVPGKWTSAFLALNLCIGEFQYDVVPFDQIIPAVLGGRVDAGLIIHEGQLMYLNEGLHCVVDLGKWWHEDTGGLPLPLGANAIRKGLGEERIAQIAPIMKQTIQYSLDHRDEALQYALKFARDLPTDLANRFVGMYVNEMTLDLGEKGKESYRLFLDRGFEAGLIPHKVDLEFVDCN